MGLLSSIKDAGKSIIGGVHKVFDKVLGVVGKFMNSAWGKGIMLAVGIFTMGTALAAGYAAWGSAAAAGGDFLASAGASASAFIGSVTGGALGTAPGAAADAGAQAAAGVAGANSLDAAADPLAAAAGSSIEAGGGAFAGGAPTMAAANTVPGSMAKLGADAGNMMGAPASTGSGMLSQAQGFLKGAGSGSGVTQPVSSVGANVGQQAGSMLGNAARGVANYASTSGGGEIVGNIIKGYGEGQVAEEKINQEQHEQRRFENLWAGTQVMNAPGFGQANPGPGYGQRAAQLGRYSSAAINQPQSTTGGSQYSTPTPGAPV